MTEYQRSLSAYAPTHAAAPAEPGFSLPLQVYIIETIERDTRIRHLRQLALVGAVVAGIFICQWPSAFNSANAVPSLPVSAQSAGARAQPVALERLAFAGQFGQARD